MLKAKKVRVISYHSLDQAAWLHTQAEHQGITVSALLRAIVRQQVIDWQLYGVKKP